MAAELSTTSANTIDWLHDWPAAVARGRAERKPVLVDVYKVPCGGCEKLDAVTFTDPRVIEAVGTRFVPAKIDLFGDRAFTREHQVFWTPTILFGDRSGRLRYTSVNFLPPDEFLDILDIGEAVVAMRWQGYHAAIDRLNDIVERRPDGPLTAEAIYWRGIAAYFRDGKSSRSANAEWVELLDRFPESIWAKRIP